MVHLEPAHLRPPAWCACCTGKAQRAKEIKRNKLDRKKAREEAHTKKDTKGMSSLETLTKSEICFLSVQVVV